MIDPERISTRSRGLASQLLRASADEEPSAAGLQRTLGALGVATAVATTMGAASAAVAGGQAAGAGAGVGAGAAQATGGFLVKWIGLGVLGGVGLAGTAAVLTQPASPAPAVSVLARVSAPTRPASPRVRDVGLSAPGSPVDVAAVAASVATSAAATPRVTVAPPSASASLDVSATRRSETTPSSRELEVGVPLAAEVAFVDQARALLSAGRTEQGLQQLQRYERQFPEARLLPEVLFLRLETCERQGRTAEARAAAQRLLAGFPKSPHAARARKLLGS